MVDGGQQSLRVFAPYPFYIKQAAGAYLYDLDQHAILDFWQGHYANILGHNPPQITKPLGEMLAHGYEEADVRQGVEAIMKQEQGVNSVKELRNRWMAP